MKGRGMNRSNIRRAALGRFPLYLKYLKSIEHESETISASAISRALGLGDVQVRKDLAYLDVEGKPKIGFVTKTLTVALEKFLGHSSISNAVIIGAGKLGSALLNYEGFKEYGTDIIAAFSADCDEPRLSESGKWIYPMTAFTDFCRKQQIRIGIITVPKESAQEICDLLIKNGIGAIWNFAPVQLVVPDGIILRQENLALSLAYLNKSAYSI